MYYILFCDDYTSYQHIYFLSDKTKETTFNIFKLYIAMAERQTCSKLKIFTLDRGGEFINELLGDELRSLGIVLHPTAPHTPEQNGISERGNRTISTKARSMMIESSIPLRFWVQACTVAVFITNRIITSALPDNITPFEAWHYRKPTVHHLKVFGCKAFRLIRKELRGSKFTPVSTVGVLVGFDEDNFNYHVYDLEDKKIHITPHVTFNKTSFPFEPDSDNKVHGNSDERHETGVNVLFFDSDSDDDDEDVERTEGNSDLKDTRDSLERLDETQDPADVVKRPAQRTRTEEPQRRSARIQQLRSSLLTRDDDILNEHEIVSMMLALQFSCLPPQCNSTVVDLSAPRSFQKATTGDEGEMWLAACDKEIKSMHDKKVWRLVDRPRNANVIRGLWLFRKKPTHDERVFKYKARFVAMGNTQIAGEDYFETFAPTGKPSSLRLIIAIAAINGWEVHQMDAVTAFLNSDLFEVIYVEQPEGYVEAGQEGKVCLLLKSLYGLKQAPKYWQDDVQEYLVSIGFKQCEIDHCVYIRSDSESGKFTAVYVHVDDLAITGNDIPTFKDEISKKWEMEDLGLASVVVGIEIKGRGKFSYSISQSSYAETVLSRFNHENSKPASTPFPAGLKLYRPDDSEIEEFNKQQRPYRRVVGSLMYLSQCTRPDIAHAVGTLSQHLDRPGFQHWNAACHVLRYIRGTHDFGIVYSGEGHDPDTVTGMKSQDCPQSHCDADWAGDKDTRRSTTGYVFPLAGWAISWKSRLQQTVALSSTEAEYRAITEAGQELLWLRNMMAKLGYEDKEATILHSDNLGAIHLTNKSVFHGRTKHVEIHYH